MKSNVIIKMSFFLLMSICFIMFLVFYSNALPNNGDNFFSFAAKWKHHNHSRETSTDYVHDSNSTIEKSFTVEPNGMLYINTDFANIRIESWEKSEVFVSVKKEGDQRRMNDYNLSFSATPQKVDIYGKANKEIWNWGNLSVTYVIKVPKNFNFDIDNSAGDVEISQANGNVKINSSAGNITLNEITGDIKVDNSAGNVRLKSIDASVSVSESAGNIEVDLKNENKGVDLETSAGNINLHLPLDVKADLNCSTSLGNADLHSDLSFSGDIDGNDINGKLNGGGKKIKLSSSIGNIDISVKKK